MWKNQGSWNFFHAKLIPNSSIGIYKLLSIRFFVNRVGGCSAWELMRSLAAVVADNLVYLDDDKTAPQLKTVEGPLF